MSTHEGYASAGTMTSPSRRLATRRLRRASKPSPMWCARTRACQLSGRDVARRGRHALRACAGCAHARSAAGARVPWLFARGVGCVNQYTHIERERERESTWSPHRSLAAHGLQSFAWASPSGPVRASCFGRFPFRSRHGVAGRRAPAGAAADDPDGAVQRAHARAEARAAHPVQGL